MAHLTLWDIIEERCKLCLADFHTACRMYSHSRGPSQSWGLHISYRELYKLTLLLDTHLKTITITPTSLRNRNFDEQYRLHIHTLW